MHVSWQVGLFTASVLVLLAALGFLVRAVSLISQVLTVVRKLEAEIGTHDTGLRGAVHRHAGRLLRLDGRVSVIEAHFKDKKA